MLVRIKGKGLKLNGKWCYKGAEVEIEETEYEKNKDYLDVIEEDDRTSIPEIPVSDEERELEELKTKAKELGIKNYFLMKKETLKKMIAEKEAPLFGQKAEEDDDEDNTDSDDTEKNDDNTNVEENPEE